MALNDPATKLANKISDIVESKINKKTKKSSVIKTGKVVRIDSEGMPWVSISGSEQETPANGELLSSVKIGDSVSINIENGKCNILGNMDDPSIGSNEAKNVSNQEIKIAVEQEGTIGRAIDVENNKTMNKIDDIVSDQIVPIEEAIEELNLETESDIQILKGKTSTSISMAETAKNFAESANIAAEEAQAVAEATGQHFWNDDNGAHVTEVTQDEWNDSSSENYHNGFNSLFGSLGLLLRKALNNIAAFTHSSVSFYDGEGNETANIVAQFGKDGQVIGKQSESHIEQNYHAWKMIDKFETVYTHISDLREYVVNGQGGVDYYATIVERYISDGARIRYHMSRRVSRLISVFVDEIDVTSSVTLATGSYVVFSIAPEEGAVIDITYYTSDLSPVYTFGTRYSGETISPYSYVFGENCTASSLYSVAEGLRSDASGYASHVEGSDSHAYGSYSHAEGLTSVASGYNSHAEGGATASGAGSHAEGGTASGTTSHSEGSGTIASGISSHAEGSSTQASNDASHSEGTHTIASGYASHAEGFYSTASESFSHAEGQRTTASGDASHAQNQKTIANKNSQTALGTYNVSDTSTTTTHPSGDTEYGEYAVMVGNGYYDDEEDEEIRSNALSVKWNGDVELPRVDIKGSSATFIIDLYDDNKQPIYRWYMSSYGSLARQQHSNGAWGTAQYYPVRDDIHSLFLCTSVSQTIGSVAAGSTKTLTFSAAKTNYDPIAISGWYMNGAAGLYPYMLRLNGSDIQCYVRNPTSSASSSTAKVEVQVLYCRSGW